MLFRLNLFLLMLFLAGLCSCRKERDETYPEISLSSPFEDQSFKVFGEIPVSGTAEDDKIIEFIRISLVNEDQKTVAPAITITAKEKKISFSRKMILEDIQMESGIYYLIATVSDGFNEKKLFRKIAISEAPRIKKGVFVITSDGLSTYVECIDSAGQVNTYTTFSGDYIGSSVSSFYQSLTVAGYKTGDVNSLSLQDKSVKWKIPATQSEPAFTHLAYLDKLNYISYYKDNLIKVHDNSGAVRATIEGYSGYYSKKLINTDMELISYQESITGGLKKLVTYNKSTGSLYHDLTIDFEVVDFCQKTGKDVLAFGNKGNIGLMRIYESGKNNEWEPVSMPAGKITCAAKLNETTYMFSNENGLYTYQYVPNSAFLFKGGNFTKFVYDDLSDIIIAAENNQVNYYDYSSGTLIHSYSFNREIKNIHVWYNK